MALTTYQHRGHGSGCVPQRSYLRHCHRTLRSFALARYVSSRAMNGCSNFPGRSLPVIRSNPALRALGGMVQPYGSLLVSSVKRSVGQASVKYKAIYCLQRSTKIARHTEEDPSWKHGRRWHHSRYPLLQTNLFLRSRTPRRRLFS